MALAAAALVVPTQQARPFRDAIGKFATGVAFVTAVSGGEPAGLIVNSLSSVSLEPPLISFSPSRSSFTWSRMRRAGRFGVNILGRQHKPFATRASPAGADRFEGIDWKLGDTGVPLLTDALAAFECEIVAEHPTGDHWIVVGQVNDLPSRRSQIRSSSSPAHSAPRDSKRMTTARAWLKVLAVDPTRDDRQASVLSLL